MSVPKWLFSGNKWLLCELTCLFPNTVYQLAFPVQQTILKCCGLEPHHLFTLGLMG